MIFQQVKASLTIKQVVQFYGVKFTRGKAICPLHGEKTPSFVIYNKNQTFQCMGCRQGGDIITFVSKLFGLKNVDAVKKLDHDFKLGLTKELTKSDIVKFKRQQQLREKQLREEQKKQDEYWRLWEVFAEYDRICIKNKPNKFGISDLWIFANEMRDKYWNIILNLQ